MDLQKVFEQQIIMHSFSYNFRHLQTRNTKLEPNKKKRNFVKKNRLLDVKM